MLSLLCLAFAACQSIAAIAPPENVASRHHLAAQNVAVTVRGDVGARTESFQVEGHEVLYQSKHNDYSWGSTFWLSPQSNWRWPPIATYDSAPYDVVGNHKALVFQSQSWQSTTITKELSFLPDVYSSLKRRYRVTGENLSTAIAPWEITRVPADGWVFFPVNQDFIQAARGEPHFEITDGILWQYFEAGSPLRESKLNADGEEGWLAFLTNKTLFLILYADVLPSEFAPGEADVEIYQSGEFPYIELEVQGPLQHVTKDQAVDWYTLWRAFTLPNIDVKPINKKAWVNFARKHAQIKREAHE